MGNFHQHLKCSSSFGLTYAISTWLFVGIDWLYGSVALLLSMLGGMLPDLDSDSGCEIKHIKSISAVSGALLFWAASGRVQPPMAFEMRVWITLFAAAFCSKGIRWILAKITVHRGMFHSIPTCFIWGSMMYLYYPHSNHWVRVYMACGIMVGYVSHLCCDEYFSVESFAGMRVNKAFGTAMKFWSDRLFSTLICYVILGLCVKNVGDVWPKGKDGQFVGWEHPSESVNRFGTAAKLRVKSAYSTVRTKGLLVWIKEMVAETRSVVTDKVEIVRENGLTKEGLKTTFTDFKEQTKAVASKSATVDTLKQLATEAKATVADQVRVDSTAGAERPLQNFDVKDGQTGKVAKAVDESGAGQKTVSESATVTKPAGKKATMEVYVPRRRSEVASDGEEGTVTRQAQSSGRSIPNRTSSSGTTIRRR